MSMTSYISSPVLGASGAIYAPRTSVEFTPEQKDLIKSTICVGATDDELKYFLYVAQKTGLDPFTKQIYSVSRWDSKQGRNVRTIQTGIDGYRVVANRTQQLEGVEGPYWCGEDEIWKDVWLKKEPPAAAKVLVWRRGCKTPFVGVAKLDSFIQTDKFGNPTSFWKKMPEVMIGKVAEAIALKKAFPQDLSGLLSEEEVNSGPPERPEPETADHSRQEFQAARVEIQNKFSEPEEVVSFSTQLDYNQEDSAAIIEKIDNRDYEVPIGTLKGKKLCQIPLRELKEMLDRVTTASKGKKLNDVQKKYIANVGAYILKYESVRDLVPETLPISEDAFTEHPEKPTPRSAKFTL